MHELSHKKTRIHSGRMRTTRSSSRLQEGGCLSSGIHTPRPGPGQPGHPPAWAWTPPRPGPGHPLLGRQSPGMGLDIPSWADTALNMSWTPPRTEFLTHACKNITFPQLCLRMVITLCFNYSLNFSPMLSEWVIF